MHLSLVVVCNVIHGFGPRTLSACVKDFGHAVRMIFINQHFGRSLDKNLCDQVASLVKPSDIVGISIVSTEFSVNAATLTHHLKRECPTLPILWGGIHPTVAPEQCLQVADMVCLGEAEETLPQLLARMERGESIRDLPGVWFNEGGTLIRNPLRSPPGDLDAIPPPDYSNSDHFLLHDQNLRPVDEELFQRYIGSTYQTLTSRGCPFKCTYCYNDAVNTIFKIRKSVRKRSIAHIMQELVAIRKRFPFFKHVCINDDSFLTRPIEELRVFAQEYRERIGLPLDIHGVIPTGVKEEKIAILVEAGAFLFKMGIETGSERTKAMYRRNYSNEHVLRAAKIINKFKDRVPLPCYDIILDNPWETNADIADTVRLLAALPTTYRLLTYPLTFYPGTKLHERAVAEGRPIDALTNMNRTSNLTFMNRGLRCVGRLAEHDLPLSPWQVSLLTSPILGKINSKYFIVMFFLVFECRLYLKARYWKKIYWRLRLGKE